MTSPATEMTAEEKPAEAEMTAKEKLVEAKQARHVCWQNIDDVLNTQKDICRSFLITGRCDHAEGQPSICERAHPEECIENATRLQ